MSDFDYAFVAKRAKEIRVQETGVNTASGDDLDAIGTAYDCNRTGCESDDYYRTRVVAAMKLRWYGKSD